MTPIERLPASKRLVVYVTNLIFNGMMGMFLTAVVVQFIIPTSFYFKYDSVYPYTVPVDIRQDSILMESNILVNRTSGNFLWNDVLRCNYDMDPEGYFQYVGQSDTSIETSKKFKEPYLTPWTYDGRMPARPALCQMNSTITREVLDFIPKDQFLQSEIFLVN